MINVVNSKTNVLEKVFDTSDIWTVKINKYYLALVLGHHLRVASSKWNIPVNIELKSRSYSRKYRPKKSLIFPHI
jgi:hypothetical protein